MYAELMLKTCPECKIEKGYFAFYKRKASKDGLHRICKQCEDIRHTKYRVGKEVQLDLQQRHWRFKNKDHVAKLKVKSKLGISAEDQDKMLLEQNYKCAICSVHQKQLFRRLALDHDHSTGKIRNFLCDRCNRALGLLHDNIEVLEKATLYLKKHKK